MKKLIFAFLLLTSLTSFSQDFHKIFRITLYKYDGDKWKVSETQSVSDLYMQVNGSKITVNNKNKSTFITIGDPKKDDYAGHVCYTWDALDKDGYDCKILMKFFFSENRYTTTIYYGQFDLAIEYTTD